METDYAFKKWQRLAVIWPVLCIIFAVIIIWQAIEGMEERAFDAGFIPIALVFFAIGMSIRRRLLKERRHATVLTTATIVSKGIRRRSGKRFFYPQCEFRIGEKTYRVTSPAGYGMCPVSKGKQVQLYYAPENPALFYIPVMQKHDNRIAALLCGIGIAFPLIALFAPLLRTLLYFLEK